MKLIWLILVAALPCQAAMTVTRELVAPEHVVPGQPVRVAVTFWTDSWFNPPPQWPGFPVENGDISSKAEPNQLLTRHAEGTSWSGVRMERQLTAWDAGKLRLPAFEMTLTASGQAPVTVKLPALETQVNWPQGIEQPDRFLPASGLSLSQKVNIYRSGKDKTLRAGDVIERVVTVRATEVMPAQIPPLLYAISGTHTQRLPPENRLLTSGRGILKARNAWKRSAICLLLRGKSRCRRSNCGGGIQPISSGKPLNSPAAPTGLPLRARPVRNLR